MCALDYLGVTYPTNERATQTSAPLDRVDATLQLSHRIPQRMMTASDLKEGQLLLAIQATRKNTNLSVRAAARIYEVDRRTLTERIRGRPSRRDTVPNLRKLTDLEELAIVQYILDLDARAFPPRLASVEDMASRLLRDRDAPPVGKNWASNFIKRQPTLQTRFYGR